MLQKLSCLLTADIRNSRSQGQAKSSSSYSPTKASNLQNPKNTGHTCSTFPAIRAPGAAHHFPLEQHLLWLPQQQPDPQDPTLTSVPQPAQHCTPHQLSQNAYHQIHPGNASLAVTQVMQKWCNQRRTFSFPQAFIYSLPCVLRLQIFLLREGFLVKAAPDRIGSLFIPLVSLSYCLFELQLKTNLIQGFLCSHKQRLQKRGRKGWLKINSQELIRVLTVALTDSQHLTATGFIPLQ